MVFLCQNFLSFTKRSATDSNCGRDLSHVRSPFPFQTKLTLEVEVNVGVAVSKLVEGVAPVHAAVLQAGVLDGERENVLVLFHWTAPGTRQNTVLLEYCHK